MHIIIQLFAPLSARNQPSDSGATLQSPLLDRFNFRDTSLWKQSVLRIEFQHRMLKNLFAKMRASPRTSTCSQQNLQGIVNMSIISSWVCFQQTLFWFTQCPPCWQRHLWSKAFSGNREPFHYDPRPKSPNLGDGDGRKDGEDSWRGQVLGFGLHHPKSDVDPTHNGT